jgi:hypothetical protein
MNSFFLGFSVFCCLAGWCDTSLIKPSQAVLEPVVQDDIPNWIGESNRVAQIEPAD